MAVNTLVKSEYLDWLRAMRATSDPASALIYDGIIKRTEDGEFDNSKNRTSKARVDCEFLQKVISHIPNEEGGKEEIGEYIVYHQCILCEKDLPCAHISRHCSYKVELDEFAEYILETVKNNTDVD